MDLIDQDALKNLKAGMDTNYHFDVPAGLTIAELNHVLCPDNETDKKRFGKKRMYNMGGGDIQTFSGAFSTGTHGSGGKYSAYHDMIRSMVLVCSLGKVYRVEPANGITDPAKHEAAYADITLIQDDDLFYSALVNMGYFGIVYSVIIEITDMQDMHKQLKYVKAGWNKEYKEGLEELVNNETGPDKHYYVTINPYKINGKDNSILIRTIGPATEPATGKEQGRPNHWPVVLANSPFVANVMRGLLNAGTVPPRRLLETALKSQDDHDANDGEGYTALAYKTWNAGSGKLKSIGTGIEFAFPVKSIVGVVNDMFKVLEIEAKKAKGYLFNAPFALRFVQPSKAYLAPNYEKDGTGNEVKLWCYLEVIRVNAIEEAIDKREIEFFEYLQTSLTIDKGRPHWGLNFKYPFTDAILRNWYPKFEEWKRALQFFNHNGTFDNTFIQQNELRTPSRIIDVIAYLPKNDAVNGEKLKVAINELMSVSGFKVREDYPAQIASYMQRTKYEHTSAVTEADLSTKMQNVKRALEQPTTTAAAQKVAEVLNGQDEAIVFLEQLLIFRRKENGVTKTTVSQLSVPMQRKLRENFMLLKDMDTVYNALSSQGDV